MISEKEYHQRDIDLIKYQTGTSDTQLIQDALSLHNNDIIATIMYLNKLESCPKRCTYQKKTAHEKQMDIFRSIIDEKEDIFYQMKEKYNNNVQQQEENNTNE